MLMSTHMPLASTYYSLLLICKFICILVQIQHTIAPIDDTFLFSRSVSQLQSGNIQQDIRQGQESNKKAFEEQRDTLTEIRVRIQQCERFYIDRGNALARGMGEAVSRLTWLLEMTTELKNKVQQIISMNYRM